MHNLTPHSKAIPEIPADGQADNEKNSCLVWTRRVITVFTKTLHSFRLLQRESSPHPPTHFFQIHGANWQLRQKGTSIFYSNLTTKFALLIIAIYSKYFTHFLPIIYSPILHLKKWEAKAWTVYLIRDGNKWQDLVSKVKIQVAGSCGQGKETSGRILWAR
jgi:hypothetical protein